ncbi:hypothetical protein [Streptomyces sp. NPDC057582]|uniref:hypothetical protein n=1 Tax=Streptomyces sp. NPDC057582 TaxID=3346174 RepID=UPI0036A789DF
MRDLPGGDGRARSRAVSVPVGWRLDAVGRAAVEGGSRVGRYVSAGRRVQELVVPKGGGRTDGFTP